MELLQALVDLFLHLDRHLDVIIRGYGAWTYLILFIIIFAETGLVVAPFLPGDSLLFAIGNVAALGSLDLYWLMALLSAAAIAGDTVNYTAGHYIGPRVFSEGARVLKKEYFDRTQDFFERYGGKTIIFARFVPIVRTFAPFVAGVGRMRYARFAAFNVAGGVLWISSLVSAGYLFGSVPFIRKNFSTVVIAIIIVSILPGLVEYLRRRRAGARGPA